MPTPSDPYEIPEFVRRKHPEMPAVMQALRQHSSGEEVTATCVTCGGTLTVTGIPELGVLEVRCANGCTLYRQRTEPARPAGDDDRKPRTS